MDRSRHVSARSSSMVRPCQGVAAPESVSSTGAYRLEPFSAADVVEARRVIERYADLDLGLADASNIVLAVRHGTLDVLPLDERHFRTVTRPDGRPFRLLSADL